MKFTPCSAVIRKAILPETANFLSVSIFSLCSRCRVNPFQMKSLISLNILFLLLLNPPLPSNDTNFVLKDRISCSTHLSISVVPYRIISIMVTDFWPAMALMLTFHITRQMKELSSMKAKKVTMQFISMHCMISPIRPTAISLCRGKRNFMNDLYLTQWSIVTLTLFGPSLWQTVVTKVLIPLHT